MTRPSADRGADSTLEHWAGLAAIATGIGGLVYAVAFLGGVVLGANPSLGMLAASIALMLGGVLSLVVLVAVYRRVSAVSHGVALVGLLVLALMPGCRARLTLEAFSPSVSPASG